MRKSFSLRTSFAILFSLLIITLTGILSTIIGKQTSLEYRNEIGKSLSNTAFQMADKLDNYMWARSGEIDLLSKLDTLKSQNNPENIQVLLDKLKLNFPAFSWVGLTDSNGKVLASTDGILKGVDISKRPVYLEALNGPFVGDVHEAVLLANLIPNPSGEQMKFVDISTPVFSKDNKFIGVLAAHLSWEWTKEIKDMIMKPMGKYNQIDLFIISSKDDAVLLGPKDMMGHPLKLQSITKSRAGNNDWAVETWPDGRKYLTGYAYGNGYSNYKGLGWTVLIRQPIDVAYAPVLKLQSFIWEVGICLSAVFAIIGWFSAGAVVKPLRKIAIAANKLRLGEDINIPVYKGIWDIEMLSYSLRQLLNNLNSTESALGNMKITAHHDHLTGLPNRTALDDYIQKLNKNSDAISLTFLYMDLDGFKAVNDTFGHHIGDLVLIEVGRILEKNIYKDDLAVRLGGDEFVLVVKNDADIISRKILSEVKNTMILEGTEVKVGCSIGGAVWPLNGKTPLEVMHLADEALYFVKRSGKNNIYFYESK